MKPIYFSLVLTAWLLAFGGCDTSASRNEDLAAAIGWYTGAAGNVDDDRARALLRRAAASNDTLAIMWIARVHSTGRMGFRQDRNLAQQTAITVIEEVERLADAGDAEASFLMGTAYAEGLGKSQDPVAAARWYERAAEMGNMLGQHNLGNIYASGTGVVQSDSLAIAWWCYVACPKA